MCFNSSCLCSKFEMNYKHKGLLIGGTIVFIWLFWIGNIGALKLNRTMSFRKSRFNYSEVLHLSLLFYEAQRSGRLPPTNRIPWRGDSLLSDKGDAGEDLSGGYFDGGLVKLVFPMAYTATVLAWGLIEYKEGYLKAGELGNGMDALRWATDFFIKAHTAPHVLYAQMGSVNGGTWGRPEEYSGPRPVFKITEEKPGTELAAETAAALAAASIVFKSQDPEYAATCLAHARPLYEFGNSYRLKYSESVPESARSYNSWSGFGDELTWSAAWIYRATGEEEYLNYTRAHLNEFGLFYHTPTQFSWDNKHIGAMVLMAKMTNETEFRTAVEKFCEYIINDAKRTPKRLVWLEQWGSLRYAANAALICMQAADLGINRKQYYSFAKEQINYILGSTGRSFVVGYGRNPPQRPQHETSSCPSPPQICDGTRFEDPAPNPHVLQGALVGGPDQDDHYADRRHDFVKNAVSLDYNAGFTSALAGLSALE